MPFAILQAHSDARLTCVNVLRLAARNRSLEDEQGRNLHLRRLAELQYWANELPVPGAWDHVPLFEAPNPAAALWIMPATIHVDHIVIGARASSPLRRYLGSISSQVVAEAPCTVTVVRATESAAS